jgi:hypothetical protein
MSNETFLSLPARMGRRGREPAACLEIFGSPSADEPLDDSYDRPEVWPPTPTVRTERALRSVPIVPMRFVRMTTFAEPGASVVLHGLPKPLAPVTGHPWRCPAGRSWRRR